MQLAPRLNLGSTNPGLARLDCEHALRGITLVPLTGQRALIRAKTKREWTTRVSHNGCLKETCIVCCTQSHCQEHI